MALAFDAVGPGSSGASGGSSPLTWSHTCTGSDLLLLAGVVVDHAPDTSDTVSVTYAGTAMTSLGRVHSGGAGQSFGFVEVFRLIAPAAGANTVSVTFSAGPDNVSAGSLSFSGADQSAGTGTAYTADSGGSDVGSGSVQVSSTTSGNICAAVLCDGSGGVSFTSGTSRWNDNTGPFNDAAGGSAAATLASTGSAVTFSWTQGTDFYGAIAVEVLAASSGTTASGSLGLAPMAAAAAAAESFAASGSLALPAMTAAGSASTAAAGASCSGSLALPAMTLAGTGESFGCDGALALPAPGLAGAAGQQVPSSGIAALPPMALAGTAESFGCDGSLALPALALSGAAGQPAPYITGISGSGRYLTDGDGNPILVRGEASWGIVFNAGQSGGATTYATDIDGYCSARAAQGYNAVLAACLPSTDNGAATDGQTWDGVSPWSGGTIGNLNDTYWQRVDYLAESARFYGITVFLDPAYGNFGIEPALSGWTAGQATSYGTALGSRYKDYPNIVWCPGGDYTGGSDTQMENLVSALAAAGDTHLVMFENYDESSSRYDGAGTSLAAGQATAGFNFIYTYNAQYKVNLQAWAEDTTYSTTAMPLVMGENAYLGSATETILRAQEWWNLTSGGQGTLNASDAVMLWDTGSLAALTAETFMDTVRPAIWDYLTSLGGWQDLIPDLSSALVTAGRGSQVSGITPGSEGHYSGGNSYVTAALTADKTLAVIYIPDATSAITVDESQLAGEYTATWADPVSLATSAATTGTTYSHSGANSAGDSDWVLVFQADAASGGPGLPPMGMAGTASAGAGAMTAAGALALPAMAAAGTGESFSCSGSLALPPMAAAGAATQVHAGSGSLALPSAGMSGSAESFACSGFLALPAPGLAAACGQEIPLSGSAALAAMGVAGSGLVLTAGAVAGALSLPAMVLAGTAESFGCDGSAALPAPGLAGTATVTAAASAAGALALPAMAATAAAESFGCDGALALPAMTAAGTAGQQISGTGSAALAAMGLAGQPPAVFATATASGGTLVTATPGGRP